MIDYHLGKANVVANTLSRKSLFALKEMNTHLSLGGDGSIIAKLRARLSCKKDDPKLLAKRELI
ncbi:integrase [Gossypium australe]|uniref:Integrase n=1 Tax=Gossypium australe TaxID=47621 RepID=A0A5B6VVJ8_9ROSI|nr:integrase [Gossypium australe]